MSAAEKSKKSGKKHIIDVQKPGTAAPSPTSKPVIVSNRPVLKDPMVRDEPDEAEEKTAETLKLSAADKPKLQPLDPTLSEEAPDDEESSADGSNTTQSDASAEKASLDTPDAGTATDEVMMNEEARESTVKKEAAGNEKAEHEVAIQRLVDSKKYVLPIQTAEQRNSRRVVILGVGLSVVLLLIWLNVALDAGIIRLGGLQSLTDLFPN